MGLVISTTLVIWAFILYDLYSSNRTIINDRN